MNDDLPPQPPAQSQSPPLASGSAPAGATPIPPSAPSSGGTKWPKVIGIIGLIIGILGVCSAPMQFLGYAGSKLQLNDIPGAGSVQDEIGTYLSSFFRFTILSSVVSLLLAGALILGSVFLLKRRRKSVPLLQVWAVVSGIVAIVMSIFTYRFTKQQMTIMFRGMEEDMGASEAQVSSAIGEVVSALAAFGGLIWALALPVFLLIWFARAKIRTETQEWS